MVVVDWQGWYRNEGHVEGLAVLYKHTYTESYRELVEIAY
jgi:hypothetical protein